MSKLGCVCGHIIIDQTDSLSYKAEIFKDQDHEHFWDSVIKEAENLIKAIGDGDREAWLTRHFLEGYPRSLEHGAVFHDFLTSMVLHYFVKAYECENCGRLWIQTNTSENRFVSFVPDSGQFEGILKSEHSKEGD